MREELVMTYHCDAENCYGKTKVYEKNGRWIGLDLLSQEVFLGVCGLPLPVTWVTVGDQHFCPNHNLSIDRNAPIKDEVKVIITGGLYEPVKEREEEILDELKKAEERDSKLSKREEGK